MDKCCMNCNNEMNNERKEPCKTCIKNWRKTGKLTEFKPSNAVKEG
jgi:hypothetical protein